jgi:hypothetical protein
MPSPTTAAGALQQQAALMPYVQAAVQAGPATEQQLIETNTNPSVWADLLKFATVTYSSGTGSTASTNGADIIKGARRPVAHAAGVSCYGATQWTASISLLIYNAATVTAGESGWCGDASTHVITTFPSFHHSNGDGLGYCNINIKVPDGWLQIPKEAGAETAVEVSAAYPWPIGCLNIGLQGLWVEQNVWASGATDEHNDWGDTN